MTSPTDSVLYGAVKDWIESLPARDRDTLLAELATATDDTPDPINHRTP